MFTGICLKRTPFIFITISAFHPINLMHTGIMDWWKGHDDNKVSNFYQAFLCHLYLAGKFWREIGC